MAYFGFKVINPEHEYLRSRSVDTPVLGMGDSKKGCQLTNCNRSYVLDLRLWYQIDLLTLGGFLVLGPV